MISSCPIKIFLILGSPLIFFIMFFPIYYSQFWTFLCARTHKTLMTSLLCPTISTLTLPSGAPKPADWRSASFPVLALPPYAPASTPGASFPLAAGPQVAAAAQTARTATSWPTNPHPPTRSPTVTPSPLRIVILLP